jgi:hypothetical protein
LAVESTPPDGSATVPGQMEADGSQWAVSGDSASPSEDVVPDPDAMASEASEQTNPLAPCSVAQDAFYVDVEGPQGPYPLGVRTFTNLNATWFAQVAPSFEVLIFGGGGSVGIYTPNNAFPSIGTFAQGQDNQGPSLELAIGDIGCAIVNGSFTIVSLDVLFDGGGPGEIRFLDMFFDLECAGYGGNQNHVHGCLRYKG